MHFEPRFDYQHAWAPGYGAMYDFSRAIAGGPLERPLVELIKLRASQINGCAYCIDMHWKTARAAGETEQRLAALPAWRETAFFTERERAALQLTESVTLIATTHVPDHEMDVARAAFTEEELAQLIYAIANINAWNRIAVAARPAVGGYQPGERLSIGN